jgi:murein tripeptide amidase MpaA
LELFDFFIIPMVNPDGVFLGNHRASASGIDLNRKFDTTEIDVFP